MKTALVFSLLFCLSLLPVPPARAQQTPQRVLAIMEHISHRSPAWQQICKGLELADAELDAIDLTIYGALGDYVANGLLQAKLTLLMQMDALVVIGHSDTESLQGFQLLQDNGVRLALLDTDAPESSRCLFIGINHRDAGALAANHIRDHLSGPICAATIAPRETNQFKDRLEGFSAAIDAQADMSLVYTNLHVIPTTLEASAAIETMLAQHPQINALYCMDPLLAVFAAAVIGQQQPDSPVYIVCNDLNDDVCAALRAGTIAAAFTPDYEQFGYQCLHMLAAAPDDAPQTIYMDCSVVTKENLNAYLSE